MAWNGTKTWAVGEVWTAGDANSYIRDNTGFLHDAPGWSVYRATNQSINNITATAISFSNERKDTSGFWPGSGNNDRVTIPTGLAGMYALTAGAEWASSAAGNIRNLQLRINGVTYIAANGLPPSPSGNGMQMTTTRIYPLAQGDYVQTIGYQDTGGALNVLTAANYSPEFAGQWLAA